MVRIIIGMMLAGYEGLNSRTHSWQYMEILYSEILQEVVLLVMLPPIILTRPYKCFSTVQNKLFQMGPEQVLPPLFSVSDTLRPTVYFSKMGFVMAIQSFFLSSFVNGGGL